MKRIPLLPVAAAFSVVTLAACSGLGEAFSAHVETVAKAGSQELSVTRLGDLLGKAKINIPLNHEVGAAVARDLWVPYQLLALAAAKNDSLGDTKAIDAAASAMLENARIAKFMQDRNKTLPDEQGTEKDYNDAKNDVYSARHILIMMPAKPGPLSRDSVRALADSIRKNVTDANFADVAKKFSNDNSKDKGGDLGSFPRGAMVKPFGDALAKLKVGEISGLVGTQFGAHIVQRNTWARAKDSYAAFAGQRGKMLAESTYVSNIQAQANVQLKSDAATSAKELAKDPMANRKNDHVVATYNGGEMTIGRLAMVLLANPQYTRLTQQITTAPDSLVNQFIINMAQREILLKRADSAKASIGPEDLVQLHNDFRGAVTQLWTALGVDPKSLADSAKTPDEKARLAAARVEAYIDRIMAGQVQPVPVAAPLQMVLMDKYDSKVNSAGVDRAIERATTLRQQADSARQAAQPKSEVPLPGAAPQAAPAAPGAVPPKKP